MTKGALLVPFFMLKFEDKTYRYAINQPVYRKIHC